MKFYKFTAALAFSGLLLAGCSTTTQMTSGTDYLSRAKLANVARPATSLEQEIRTIAAVEPDLHFPARIGLARIESGRLTTASASEMMSWGDLAQKLGAPYGEFVPVSPFIATMVRPQSTRGSRDNVVADIRRASARQHLDYVLVYEVSQNISDKGNALALADLTILGLFVLPSRSVKINSTASAILIDVRNGYPYGTATAFAYDMKATTRAGSGSSRRKAKTNNHLQAVENLTGEVETMMKELWVLQAG